MEKDPGEKAIELLGKISIPCPIDDAENIYRHIDENGKVYLVSIPENEEDKT